MRCFQHHEECAKCSELGGNHIASLHNAMMSKCMLCNWQFGNCTCEIHGFISISTCSLVITARPCVMASYARTPKLHMS
jgi:hypothetical protein